MKKSIIIALLSVIVVSGGFAQSTLKGPAYKNAKPSEKYEGASSVLIKENPRQFQGPEYKNLDRSEYDVEVIDDEGKNKKSDADLIVSTKNVIYTTDEGTEKIIYRRIETNELKGKNTKGLKGPAYKNFKR